MKGEAITAAAQDSVSRATLDDYVSTDECMLRCLRLATLAARTDLPVLVLGESGTGKTMIAQAIHRSSGRRDGPFVSFNAAALSDTLLDSQLFGHEKGAFTGADRQVKGRFESAHGGTLFFDEIADLSPAGQAKILRAVEGGEFERLGGESLLRADVRLITATCHPIQDFVTNKQFRRDLFYRIKGISLLVPPLRERRRDLPRLIRREIRQASEAMRKPMTGIEADALDLLLHHAWPGNLRELRQVVHVAVALAERDTIALENLILDDIELERPRHPTEPAQLAAHETAALSLADAEKAHIEGILRAQKGNKRQSAKILGVSRSTLDRKIEQYGIQ